MKRPEGRRLALLCMSAALTLGAAAFLCIVLSELLFFIYNGNLFFLRKGRGGVAGSAVTAHYRAPITVKKNGRIRILAIGGSTTYGFGIGSKFTWPRLLSEKLEREFPGRYEVINLGRPGGHLEEFIQDYTRSSNVFIPREEWIMGKRPLPEDLADWGWKDLKPEIVLLAPVVNDTAPDYLHYGATGPVSRAAGLLNDFLDGGFFYDKLAMGFYIRRALALFAYGHAASRDGATGRLSYIKDEYRRNLIRFIRLWNNDARLYLLGFPLLFNRSDGQREALLAAACWNLRDTGSIVEEVRYMPLLEELEREVRRDVARDLGIPYWELSSGIKSMKFSSRLRFYIDSIHMNKDGSGLLAEEIYEMLCMNGKGC